MATFLRSSSVALSAWMRIGWLESLDCATAGAAMPVSRARNRTLMRLMFASYVGQQLYAAVIEISLHAGGGGDAAGFDSDCLIGFGVVPAGENGQLRGRQATGGAGVELLLDDDVLAQQYLVTLGGYLAIACAQLPGGLLPLTVVLKAGFVELGDVAVDLMGGLVTGQLVHRLALLVELADARVVHEEVRLQRRLHLLGRKAFGTDVPVTHGQRQHHHQNQQGAGCQIARDLQRYSAWAASRVPWARMISSQNSRAAPAPPAFWVMPWACWRTKSSALATALPRPTRRITGRSGRSSPREAISSSSPGTFSRSSASAVRLSSRPWIRCWIARLAARRSTSGELRPLMIAVCTPESIRILMPWPSRVLRESDAGRSGRRYSRPSVGTPSTSKIAGRSCRARASRVSSVVILPPRAAGHACSGRRPAGPGRRSRKGR